MKVIKVIKDDTPPTEVSWNQKFTDFTVVLKSGEKVKVHRHVLAENSDVFDAMLTQDTQEKNTNQMSFEHWDEAIAISFLEYLYSGSVDDEEIIGQLKEAVGINEYIFRRSFKREKLTVELLKMADMYQVEDLKKDCTEYLKKNLHDDNVMEVWMGSQNLDNKSLSSAVTRHLADRPQGKTLKDVPGFCEAFQSSNNPLTDLVKVLSEQVLSLSEKDNNLEFHAGDCEYRLINCSFLNCKTRVPMAEFLDHMEKDHKKEEDFCGVWSGPERDSGWTVQNAWMEATTWIPIHIKFGGQHFFLEMWRSDEGVWCIWMYMLGTHQRCQEYRYTITLSLKDEKEEKELTYCGPVIPMDHSKEKVVELGNCLVFSDLMAKQFVVKDGIDYKTIIEPVV